MMDFIKNKNVILATRFFLGLIFFIFGGNGLLIIMIGKGFFPEVPPPPEAAAIFGAFKASKYIMPAAKLVEFVTGLMFLTGMYIPLAIVLLGPLMFNIFGLQIFVLNLQGIILPSMLLFSLSVQAYHHWDKFTPLLDKK